MARTQAFIFSLLFLIHVVSGYHIPGSDLPSKRALVARQQAIGQKVPDIASLQSSLCLDESQVQAELRFDGTSKGVGPGVAPSLTSSNNFINYCLTQSDVPLTNGRQVEEGSCNPTPMGRILAKSKMPSVKFRFPTNGAIVSAKTNFTIEVAIRNLHAGVSTNSTTNYFSAPQRVDADGFVIGHTHVVLERIPDITSTDPLDPLDFVFFKGLNTPAVNNTLTAEVGGGLEPGIYRASTISTASNHQPILAGVAQHGNFEDMVYFKVAKTAESSSDIPVTSSAI